MSEKYVKGIFCHSVDASAASVQGAERSGAKNLDLALSCEMLPLREAAMRLHYAGASFSMTFYTSQTSS
ncbi:hypothetical protein [Fischerella sp. PCC 9605]|uniref:hypothetical protein n=1 Tax=Fischerella sp. PCC 9605 TaxID=1173024 RepID=UPI0012DE3455|nr:hypothetical protein [Fischerella sp. PCC 9605]